MRLLRRLAKLRGRSAAELRERLEQFATALAERGRLVDAGEPDDATFRKRLLRNVAAVGFEPLVTSVRDRARPYFFAGAEHLTSTALTVRGRWPARAAEIVRVADDVVAGRFQLLGYPAFHIPEPIDWSRDLVTGVRAPDAHWSTIPYLDAARAGDHKLIWELNRHQFLVTLGQAYQLTGDERYPKRAVQLLQSWMDANPPKRGVNWASSLEVAYRSIAWIWAYRLMRQSPAFTRPVVLRWLKFVEVSGRHVARYLSTYFSPNTHLTGEALALLYLGLEFPELAGASRWVTRGWKILLGQLQRQVRPDGTYFEQATYYHRYALDIAIHARILGGRHGLPDVERFDDAIGRLAECLAWTSRSDGTSPLFGDEDGGRLLFLDGRAADDVRSPLATAATLLGRGDLAAVAGASSDELAWLLGAEGVQAYDRLAKAVPERSARAFPDGGVFVMRDGWRADSAVLTVDCGPLGADSGGHAHADTLAFDLAVGRASVFVDAGTVTYTANPALRDELRSSLAHNTVSLDGLSSSEVAGPFQWKAMTTGVLDAWHATPAGAFFEGHHDGYARLPSPARHRRTIVAARDGWWLVRDVIEGEGAHEAVATFQCAGGLDVAIAGETLRVADDGRPVVSVVALGAPGEWSVEAGIASRRYGARDEAPRARYAYATRGTTAVTYAITRRAVETEIRVERRGLREAVRLRTAAFDDLVLWNPDDAVDGLRTDARVAWIRRRVTDGVVDSLMVIGATVVELDGAAVAQPGGGVVSAVRERGEWRVARTDLLGRPGSVRPGTGRKP